MLYKDERRHAATGTGLDEVVAVFAGEMGNVEAGERIGAEDGQRLPDGENAHRLSGAQHRKRAFEPAQIEFYRGVLDHSGMLY